MVSRQGWAFVAPMVMGMGMVLGLGAGSVATAEADGAVPAVSACGVPVCDVASEIERLSKANQNGRWQKLVELRSAYSKSTDVAILKNLADFAEQLEALSRRLGDEDWMVGGASGLRTLMLVNLAKYSELDVDQIAGYYATVRNEDTRYDIIKYWREKAGELEDREALFKLSALFERFAQVSRGVDSAYVANDAMAAVAKITARIVALYPYHEGSYRISVSCEWVGGAAPARLPVFCQGGFINRLVIMDTLVENGLQITLSNGETGTMIYHFTDVTSSEPGRFAARDLSAIPSQLSLKLNREAGTLSGAIRNTDTQATLRIEGRLEATPASVFDLPSGSTKPNPLSQERVSRIYKGKYGTHPVVFSVLSMADKSLTASMTFLDSPNLSLHFQVSRFFPQLGILTLVGSNPGGSRMKLTLSINSLPGGNLSAQGFAFTDRKGVAAPVVLETREN